jgi:pilus assembly protein CpaE
MPPNDRIRIVLALVDTTARQQLRQALEATGRVLVVGEAADTNEAVDRTCLLDPEVLVVEAAGDRLDAYAATETVMRLQPVPVVVLSERTGLVEARRALAAAARDLVPRNLPVPGLVSAIETARGQQRPPASTGSRGRVMAVFSTKGGVGKSTIATNLAISLARVSRRRVAVLDLDLEFGCQAALMGIQPSASIVDVTMLDRDNLGEVADKVLERTPYAGVRLLAAPPSPELAGTLQGEDGHGLVAALIEALRASYQYILVDLAGGLGELNLVVLEHADLTLLVTTPDIPALQNTGKCLDMLVDRLDFAQDSVRLVLNRANAALGLPVADIPRQLGFPVSFRLPSDGKTAVWAANTGFPFAARRSRSPLALGVVAMARQLVDERVS